MPIVMWVYWAVGVIYGCFAFREIQRGKFTVDLVTDAYLVKSGALSRGAVRGLAYFAFASILLTVVVAWPLVALYDLRHKSKSAK